MGRFNQALLNSFDEKFLQRGFLLQVQRRRISPERAQDFPGILGRTKLNRLASRSGGLCAANKQNVATRLSEVGFHREVNIFQNANHPDHRRRINPLSQSLVIQAHIAAGDGSAQRFTGLAYAVDHLRELPHDLWFFRIAEVQAVGSGNRSRAGAGDITRGFSDGVHGSQFGIEPTPESVAIE